MECLEFKSARVACGKLYQLTANPCNLTPAPGVPADLPDIAFHRYQKAVYAYRGYEGFFTVAIWRHRTEYFFGRWIGWRGTPYFIDDPVTGERQVFFPDRLAQYPWGSDVCLYYGKRRLDIPAYGPYISSHFKAPRIQNEYELWLLCKKYWNDGPYVRHHQTVLHHFYTETQLREIRDMHSYFRKLYKLEAT